MKNQTKLTIGAFLVFFLTITVFAFSGTLESKIKADITMTRDAMTHLQSQNDKYRSELSVLEPRVKELQKLIHENKDRWYGLRGELGAAEKYLESLMKEDQRLKD